jgi:histidyl-tRNA synthetase
MIEKGIEARRCSLFFNFTGTITEKIEKLGQLWLFGGMKGIDELRFICDNVTKLGLSSAILDLDVTSCGGLNYYTGNI